jgi:hypothetical protein
MALAYVFVGGVLFAGNDHALAFVTFNVTFNRKMSANSDQMNILSRIENHNHTWKCFENV